MTDYYYDYNNGSAGNDGLTPATAKATRSQAEALTTPGSDDLIAVDGIQTHESGHFLLSDNVTESSQTFRGATLQANTAETTRVARTNSDSSSANNPHLIKGFVFDGQSGNGGSGVTQAFDIGRDSGEDLTYQFHNCEFICGNTYGLLLSNRRGRLEVVNCKISGTLPGRAFGATSSLSGDGNQVIDVNGVELSLDPVSSASKVIEFSQVSSPTNSLDLYFKALNGVVRVAATGSGTLLDVLCKDTINIAGADITIEADEAVSSSFVAISTRGRGSGFESSDVNITNNKINFFSPIGFGIAAGLSTTDSHITNGSVSGNVITGKFYPAPSTPHNMVLGQGTAFKCTGNKTIDGYVGILVSITDSGTEVVGNTLFDCYGPNIYMKGVAGATVKDNTCTITSKFTQRDRGILAVAPQGATNTAACTIQENLVIVQDLAKIHSLGYIEDASQTCSFIRNTYIVDEAQYNPNSDYFSYHNGAGGAANNTLSEWNAQAEVTEDVIITMPASEIANLIAAQRAIVSSIGAGTSGVTLMGFNQSSLDLPLESRSGSVSTFSYRTGDTKATVQEDGYFEKSRFRRVNGWRDDAWDSGGWIDCQCSDGYTRLQVDQSDTANTITVI